MTSFRGTQGFRKAHPALRAAGLRFGEIGWEEEMTARQERTVEAWLRTLARPVVVEPGVGMALPSVRRFFGHRVLGDFGGRVLRINPREPVPPTPLDIGLAMGTAAALAAIDAAIAA